MSTTNPNSQADKRKNIENMYPLSPLQEGFLYHTLLEPDAGVYTPQIVIRFRGELDTQAFEKAWQDAILRHSSLRSAFYWEQRDEPFQVVYKQVKLDWQERDWRSLDAHTQADRLEALLFDNRRQPFDLQAPSLMRLCLIALGPDSQGVPQYQLVWCFHHLILDGWSSGLLFKDVFSLYLHSQGVLPSISAAPRPYADYIGWLKAQDQASSLDFWRDYFKGSDTPTLLCSHLAKPQGLGLQEKSQALFSQQALEFSVAQTQAIRAFSQGLGITVNTLLQGLYGFCLSQYTRQNDVCFGSISAGRPTSLEGADQMIGLFINNVPVRTQLEPEQTIGAFLQALQQQQADAASHEFIPLRQIQQHCHQGDSWFDSLLVFESYPVNTETFKAQNLLTIDDLAFDEWTHYPLTLLVSESDTLKLMAKSDNRKLDPSQVQQLLESLQTVLEQALENDQQAIDQLCLQALKNQAIAQVQAFSQGPVVNYSHNSLQALLKTLPPGVDAKQIAIVMDEQRLSYGQLHQQADTLAAELLAQGIGPESRVAVYLPRSCNLMRALLAIVKTGAAFVPIEPDYPASRREWILQDAKPELFISDTALLEAHQLEPMASLASYQSLDLATFDFTAAKPMPELVLPAIEPNNSAYVLYTSGSTGKPKGVINTQGGIANRLQWMQDYFAIDHNDKVLQKTPLGFDVSVWELFWPLMTGASLVLAKPQGHKDASYLTDLIQDQGISCVHFVPPMLSVFLEQARAAACTSLKHVILSGEALSSHLQQRFFNTFSQASGTELYNLYGPTEAAIDVSVWHCQRDQHDSNIPIGHPIANTQLYVLNPSLKPLPQGLAGELYIGGANLARGYLGRDDLSAERFIDSPFELGQKLYQTGDLARVRADGAIEYLGRLDHQVKIRGVRIELGEIEAVLESHPRVRQAIALTFNNHSEDCSLSAYITLTQNIADEQDDDQHDGLKQALLTLCESQLPAAAKPSSISILDALPLTANGKPDRSALEQPTAIARPSYEAPQTPTEQSLAAIWQQVLKLDRIGRHDHFFELGGHSLLATRAMTRIQKTFEVELPLQRILERPVLLDLANHIDALLIQTAPTEDDHVELDLF